MKELPKVFVSPIEKKIQNNKDLFYSKLLGDRSSTRNILNDIDAIFKDGVQEETLVGKTGTSLLTMDGKVIPISEIKEIKKI